MHFVASMKRLVLFGALLIPALQAQDSPGNTTRDGRLSPLLSNLGKMHRPVSTKNAEAQRYFDQGLILIYGFNHGEAIRSFREAARLDPNLAMAYWGEALATGPNINDAAADAEREKTAYEAMQQALKLRASASKVEQALIDALSKRFTNPAGENREARMKDYAEAMARVYKSFPRDPDVAVLYAGAVMDSMPWDYYENGRPKPAMIKPIRALEKAIRQFPLHPGAHHYYIHAIEASADPDRAVRSADVLPSLVPGAGHLVHMPAHIYIRVGRYADASESNIRAIKADEDYITQCRIQGIYPAVYYPHNVHFLTAVLAMEGRAADAIAAARKSAEHTHAGMDQPGFAFPHLLAALPKLTYVRFGRWKEIEAEPEPQHSEFDKAMWRFARGMAFAATGRTAEGAKELEGVEAAAKSPELAALKIFDLNPLASLAAIAADVLAGELAAAKGDFDTAIGKLRSAVARDDNLLYSEPPDWPNPPRHNLGSVLLKAGRAKEAEAVYREDLQRHRNNGWSLAGLAKALEAQGKAKEATETRKTFEKSWKRADTKIDGSRMM